MDNAHDDPAPRRPTGSESETAGLGSAAEGSGVADVQGSRKPRIEVLRAGPATAPERGFASSAREPRIEVLGGAGQGTSHANATSLPPGEPTSAGPSVRRTGRGPFGSSPMLLGLTLLLLLVIAGLFLVPFFQEEGEDIRETEVAATSTPKDIPEDGPIDDEPPPVDEPIVEQPAAEAGPDSQPYLPDPRQAAPGNQTYSPEPRQATSSDRPYSPEPRRAAPSNQPYSPEPRAVAAPETRELPNGEYVPPADEASAPADPVEDESALRTVRAFYTALSAGDGASAAQFVVAAKRRSGPLSAGALTRYYSSFRRPLRVLRVTAVDPDTVRVAYDYVLADGRLCQGQSAVNVVQGSDRTLIGGIRTQGPC